MDFSPLRKLFFSWISVAAVLTFAGDATNAIVHALVDKKDNWWCGESVVVRYISPFEFMAAKLTTQGRSTLWAPSSFTFFS